MSEVIISVLEFIKQSNANNPIEILIIFIGIGYALYYVAKIQPEKEKIRRDAEARRDDLEERRLSQSYKINSELHNDIIKQSELLKNIQIILTNVDATLDDINDTLIKHDERSKGIDSENKRFHDTSPQKDDFDKIESKIEYIQRDITTIKALINNVK